MAEICGKDFFELNFPNELAKRLQKQIAHVFATKKTVRDDTPFTGVDGEVGSYEYILNPVLGPDGSVELVAGSTRDLSERRDAEKAIRFQARLLDTVESSVIATDLGGIVTYWNDFAEKLYGWTGAETLGRNILDLTLSESENDKAAEIMSQLTAGESWSGEFLLRRKDGSTFPGIVSDSPIQNPDGELIGIVGVSTDITERKRREESLKFLADFSQHLLEISRSDLIADTFGQMLSSYNNASLCAFFDINLQEKRSVCKDEWVGVGSVSICGNHEMKTMLTEDFHTAMLSGQTVVVRDVNTDPRVIDRQKFADLKIGSLVNVPLIREGEWKFVIGVFHATPYDWRPDEIEMLTEAADRIWTKMERLRITAALRKSEERVRILLESVEEYTIITADLDGTITGWNIGAEKIFGYKPAEIIGKNIEIIFTPEDRIAGVPAQEIFTAVTESLAEDERFHLHKNGSRFFLSGVMQPFKDSRLEGVVKIARDMTGRINAERVERDKALLQKIVLVQEDERKRIARDLHDELGQLLTALRLNLEAVRRLCDDQDHIGSKVSESQALAKRIDEGIDFLSWELRPAVLDALGLYAALGRYVVEWSHYSGITAELLVSRIKKIRLERDVETNLYRIAQEALNNVNKHSNAQRVEVVFEKRRESIVLIIEDDGVGFDPSDKLNRPTGIGLIGMQERAALIGGSVEIESTPGNGTTIYVRVPIALTTSKGKNA